jgi:hypothetical protein
MKEVQNPSDNEFLNVIKMLKQILFWNLVINFSRPHTCSSHIFYIQYPKQFSSLSGLLTEFHSETLFVILRVEVLTVVILKNAASRM